MFRAFALSLGQLGDRPVLAVLAKSLALTLVIFVVLGAGVWWGTQALLASWTYGGALASAAALVVTVLALWLLFRAVAILVIGVLADDVVAAVEAKHYPVAVASARAVPLHRSLNMGLRSAARFVGVNLLLLPLYIVLLATGIGTAALFFAANAFLLGRDLGDMVAARHMDAAAMREWRRTNGARRFLLGLAGTGLFVVPVLNILAPVLGAAMATHLFHGNRT
ncbi:EI24 domain-containing protein [Sphingomonas sp. SUN019]|uniref:EI24 domain-containing protein n=1 Tax=Sphingomonas sp. SUN019 TaxID=2937788 RepID=UPI0021645E64|nr:EI24 domain-containing protein [Sphingomonas sp. SUN019]UVO50047.1 EI24 domain-containing protein [Sphingomonas sp. SUN019]